MISVNHGLLVLFSAPMLANGIQVENYSDATNLRFSEQSGFIGDPYDLSGVGRTTNSITGSVNRTWATLIGENTFVSAVHFHPNTGETIRFADGNSSSSPTYDYIVKGGFAVPGTDIWIGYTEEAISSSLQRYSLDATPANSLADTGLAGETLLLSGDNAAGGGGLLSNQVLATNQAESWWEDGSSLVNTPEWGVLFSSAATFDRLITFANDSGDNANNFTTYEGQVQGGDSGAPLFSVSSGSLEIVGLGWAAATNLNGNFVNTGGQPNSVNDPLESRDASFFSYVGSYESEINTTLANVPAAIPEPGSAGLLSLAALFTYRRRRSS